MPDISMCDNDACPSRRLCYRYMADPDEYMQSYCNFTVYENRDKCESFWPIEPGYRLREEGRCHAT
jgi:hypothetical protein